MVSDTNGSRKRLDIRQFSRPKLDYDLDERTGSFRHNYDRDLHLFIIWPHARSHEAEIMDLLAGDFSILDVTEVYWSRDELLRNYRRLYREPYGKASSAPSKVGDGHFVAVVVEDEQPAYLFDRSVSGAIECTNPLVSKHKRLFREWVGGYGVHSSNAIGEFFEQAPLLFGVARLNEIIDRSAWNGKTDAMRSDLAGTSGWASFEELFEILGLASNYVVLRGFETLPDSPVLEGQDIDILCEDLAAFIAATNARLPDPERKPHKCIVQVGGIEVHIDARYIGDGYYDARWQSDMLRRQTVHKRIVRRPRDDDYFFSLLYHAKLHKTAVKPEYVELLPRLATSIGMSWFSSEDVLSDESSAEALSGFMEPNGYRYVRPVDRGVTVNREFLKLMPTSTLPHDPGRRRIVRSMYTRGRRLFPQRLRSVVPLPWKTRATKYLRL